MAFTQRTAHKLRIPVWIVDRATTALLQLLRRHGHAADVALLLGHWAEAAALLDRNRAAVDQQGPLTRLGNFVFAMPSTTRNAKSSLRAAGLDEAQLVPAAAELLATFDGDPRVELTGSQQDTEQHEPALRFEARFGR